MNTKCHILALLGATSFSLSAQVAYQGRLIDDQGAPLPDGPKTISFDLFAGPTGGTSAWNEALQVDTIDGRFSVTLGADESINTQLAGNQYLQLTVGGDALMPRQKILASPVALTAESLTGNTWNANGTAEIKTNGNTKATFGELTRFGAMELKGGHLLLDEDFGILSSDGTTLQAGFDTTADGNLGLFAQGLTRMTINPSRQDGLIVSTAGGLEVGGNLVASGRATINGGATLNGVSALVGTTTMTNGGEKVLTINTAGSGFRRPLEIFDANTLVFGYQWNTPSTGLFIGRGTAFKPGGGSFAATSDGRLKKEVQDLHGSLDRLEKLRPVTFKFRNEGRHGVNGVQAGFIAQEVERVFPSWVIKRDNSAPRKDWETPEPEVVKAIDITGFEALTVDALRELRAEKNAQIAALKTENETLSKRIKALEDRLTGIMIAIERDRSAVADKSDFSDPR